MMDDIDRILISQQELEQGVAKLGAQIAAEYADKNPVFLGVLKGVVVYFSDMIRATPIPCEIDFLAVSSYRSGTNAGKAVMKKDVSIDIRGRHVVILEDILDTGKTLKFVVEHLLSMEPASLKICTLLDKPDRREVEIEADYVGFTIPNEFVVGYGLDFAEKYRNLPFVGVLKPEIYEKA